MSLDPRDEELWFLLRLPSQNTSDPLRVSSSRLSNSVDFAEVDDTLRPLPSKLNLVRLPLELLRLLVLSSSSDDGSLLTALLKLVIKTIQALFRFPFFINYGFSLGSIFQLFNGVH